MPADIASMVAGALAEALGPVVDRLKIVRTRSAPTAWHDVRIERTTFKPGVTRGTAVWSYKNRLATTISIRRLQVAFQTVPDANWKPIVEVHVDGATVIKSAGNAFESADLDVDLYGGRPLLRDRLVEVFIWNGEAGEQTNKDVVIFIQAAEL